MYTIDELELKCREIHGDKYEYDWSTYTKMTNKMRIVCSEHGEFWQSLHEHINKKQGCKYCSIKNKKIVRGKNKNKKLTVDEYIDLCNKKWKNKFKYPCIKDEYQNLSSKITVICPIHGKTTQTASVHLNSKFGCKECAVKNQKENQTRTTDEFIFEAKKIHGDKYDYSKVEYVDCHTKVCITCPKHGEFWQTPANHLSGNGCPKCGYEKTISSNQYTTETFICEAKKIHGDKYNYSKVEYIDSKTKVCIICPQHGEFYQSPDKHLQGEGCPKCGNQVSNAENEIFEFCCNHLGVENVEQGNREMIKPYELDIFLPTLNIGIEYNGLRWHSEKFGKDKNYHLNKLNKCKKNGIKLIQVFEDEYIQHKNIVFNKIKHILKLNENLPKIMGRKCIIKEINKNDAERFLNMYHIQGFVASTVYLGSFYNDELIAVMTFKEESKNSGKWELNRFASNYNYICQGVGGKLFKYFTSNYNPIEVKSFADRRWTINEDNNMYLQLDFKFDSYTNPDYHYFKESDGLIRQHKFAFRKNKLHNRYGLDTSLTESQMVEELGYTKIYDCGLIKYIWTN